jgi:GntR family transcriptional regulator, transcriptional repressor for pyruvate dehydrogenase complex
MPRPVLESPFSITGIARPRIYEAVADQIRQAIFNGLLNPGHKLPPEREMAEHFQTSRVTLKEALRALEKEGLIMIRRGGGGGAFVADFDNALNALADLLKHRCKTRVRQEREPDRDAFNFRARDHQTGHIARYPRRHQRH